MSWMMYTVAKFRKAEMWLQTDVPGSFQYRKTVGSDLDHRCVEG